MILRILLALFGLFVLSVGAGMFLFVGPEESEIPTVTLAEFERDPGKHEGWLQLTDYRLGEEAFLIPNPLFDGEELAERAIPLRPIGTEGNDEDAVVALIEPALDDATMRLLYAEGPLLVNRATVFGESLDSPTPDQLLDLEGTHPEYEWGRMIWVSESVIGPYGIALPSGVTLVGAFFLFAALVLMRKKKRRHDRYEDDWSGSPESPPPLS